MKRLKLTDVVVYGKENCGYCKLARFALATRGVHYRYVSLDHPTIQIMREFRAAAPGAKTVPQITIAGKLIGGWDDLVLFLAAAKSNHEGDA